MLGRLKWDPDVSCGAGRALWEGGLLGGGPDLQFAHAGWGAPRSWLKGDPSTPSSGLVKLLCTSFG